MQFITFSFYFFLFFWYCTIPYKTAVCTNTHIENTNITNKIITQFNRTYKKVYNKTRIILIIFLFTRFVQMFAFCFVFFYTLSFFQLNSGCFSFTCDPQLSNYSKWQFYQLKYTFCSESDFFYPVFLNIKY